MMILPRMPHLGVPGRAPVIVGTFVSSGQVSNRAGGVAIAAARRDPARALLNVEGYAVILHDADGVTVVLDEPPLREQFGISP